MIIVERTNSNVRVTIPNDAISLKRMNALLDWLRIEEIAQRSRLTEEDADNIANEIKAEWWAANKDRFPAPDKP